jgi:hypothetical protein
LTLPAILARALPAAAGCGGARNRTDRRLNVEQLASFGEDARGRVYVPSGAGPVHRLVR